MKTINKTTVSENQSQTIEQRFGQAYHKKTLTYVAMPYDQGKSGISEYIRSTLYQLSQEQPIHLIALERDATDLKASLAKGPHRVSLVSNRWAHPVMNLFWFAFMLPLMLKKKPQQNIFIPAGNRRCLIANNHSVVTTVHDLAAMHLSNKYDPLRSVYLRYLLPWVLKRAGKLVAISEKTRQDLIQFTGVKAEQITLAYNGYQQDIYQPRQQHLSPAKCAQEDSLVLNQYDLKRPYILYVARIEHPGKNHLGLLQAWQALPENVRSQHLLVLAGSDWSGAEHVHTWLAENNVPNVKLLGYVPAQDLPALYRGARLYVQPSLFEGFGLPIIEAMACGTPVLSSNQGALAEIGAEAVRLFDPTQPGQLQAALQELLASPEALGNLSQSGLERVKNFSWQNHTEILNQLFLPSDSVQLLGVKMFNGTLPQVLYRIKNRIKNGQLTRLFYVNADCLNIANSNPHYRKALSQADLILPDGSGVALGARLTQQRLKANLNGTDMFVPLCHLAQKEGLSVYFLGARPDVVSALSENVKQRWPQLKIAGSHHGFIAGKSESDVLKELKRVKPDILFVAMGAPRQEQWIIQHAQSLQIPLMLGVGGLFDFYSGRIPRAPMWLRRIGCEWCWRLLQEPQRLWQRYLVGNPLFIWRVLRHGKNA